jgi:hypothetical protein
VAGASITAAQAAVNEWAEPLCITAVVVNADALAVDVTALVSGSNLPAGFETFCEDALEAMFAAADIGTSISLSAIITKIHTTLVSNGATNVSVSLVVPAAPVTPADNEVPVLGTVSITEA